MNNVLSIFLVCLVVNILFVWGFFKLIKLLENIDNTKIKNQK
ncbi:MAG: hypothetical protein ACRCXA_05415 [Peptostreptococcaceae bacterium]